MFYILHHPHVHSKMVLVLMLKNGLQRSITLKIDLIKYEKGQWKPEYVTPKYAS